MHRVIGGSAAATVFFILLAAGTFIIIAPPDPAIRWLSASVLKTPVEWRDSFHQNGSLKVRGIRYPLSLARFEAAEAVLKKGLAQGVFWGFWDIDLLNMRLLPTDPRWPELNFSSGQAIWRSRSRILELRNWTSKLARFDADIRFDESGRLAAADVRGDADPTELTKAVSGWKVLKTEDPAKRRSFHLEYTQGRMSIQVDEKSFFKASWNGNVNF